MQFAGRPGSGKTELSRAVAPRIGASVLDLDVVKTALLDSGVCWDDAGRTAYNVMFALAADLLRIGRPVIVDSPSRWEIIPRRGQAIAAELGVPYVMVECRCADEDELRRRLAGRPRMRSQMVGVDEGAPEATRRWADEAKAGVSVAHTVGPDGGWLTVDTMRPTEYSTADVLDHLQRAHAQPPNAT